MHSAVASFKEERSSKGSQRSMEGFEAWRPGIFFCLEKKQRSFEKGEKVDKEGKAYLVPWCVEGVSHWRYYYFFSKAELKKILKQAGFEILGSSAEKNLCFLCQKK
jgi:hypothetical protein